MSSKKMWSAAFAASVAALAFQPAAGLAADPGVTNNEITIGLFAPMSGQLANFGFDPLQAAKMWYEDVNKKGGINGPKIKTLVEDAKCNPTEAVAVVKKLVTVDNVFLVNGGSCTAAAVAVQEFVTREKVPFVMLNAAGDGAVHPPTKYVYGAFGGTQRSVGATLMEFAVKELKGKKIAYFADDNEFGNANFATAKATADRLGVEIVTAERLSPGKTTDVTAQMLKARQAQPDVIISAAYPAGTVLLVQKYGEYAMSKIPFVIAVQGIPDPVVFAKNVGNDAALANVYYSSPLNDLTEGPKQQKWLAMYKQYYPDRKPTAYMTYGLPAAMAVTRALQKAGRDLTREKFIAAMDTTNFESDVLAGPTVFGPNRRDGYRSSIFIKFDGKNSKLMPGSYTWNGTDGALK